MYTTLDLDRVDLNAIVESGRKIYQEKYQVDFEARLKGKIVAIDIETQHAFIGRSMREAGEQARRAAPDSLFFFLKVGAPAVYTRR